VDWTTTKSNTNQPTRIIAGIQNSQPMARFLAIRWPQSNAKYFQANRLPYVPDSENQFKIWADKINKSGVMVDVIEVIDPAPVDPTRREDNEIKNRKPLRFGSRTDVTTSGNWE
jgi:hypothetical protein